jgi:hypothetical protein
MGEVIRDFTASYLGARKVSANYRYKAITVVTKPLSIRPFELDSTVGSAAIIKRIPAVGFAACRFTDENDLYINTSQTIN